MSEYATDNFASLLCGSAIRLFCTGWKVERRVESTPCGSPRSTDQSILNFVYDLSSNSCHTKNCRTESSRNCRLDLNRSKHNRVGQSAEPWLHEDLCHFRSHGYMVTPSRLSSPFQFCVCADLFVELLDTLLLACGSPSTADAYRCAPMHLAIEEDASCTSRNGIMTLMLSSVEG